MVTAQMTQNEMKRIVKKMKYAGFGGNNSAATFNNASNAITLRPNEERHRALPLRKKQRLFLVPIPGYYFADNEALRGTTQQPRIATSDSLPGLPRDKQGTGGSALEKKPWRRQGPYA